MKNLLSLLFTAVCIFSVADVSAEGLSARSERKLARKKNVNATALNSVCKSIQPMVALLKSTAGGHIRGDPRESGYSLICSRKSCPKKFPTNFYYSDGSLAFTVGLYGRWSGNGQPRAYCAAGGAPKCSAKSIGAKAKSRGLDGKVYGDFGNGKCYSANPTPGVRNGSPF